MLEKALQGARLLYAYTIFMDAPLDNVFNFTGNPAYWTRDFNGQDLPCLALSWKANAISPAPS